MEDKRSWWWWCRCTWGIWSPAESRAFQSCLWPWWHLGSNWFSVEANKLFQLAVAETFLSRCARYGSTVHRVRSVLPRIVTAVVVQLAPHVLWVTVTRGESSSVALRTISFLHAPPCDPLSTPAASAQHLRFFIVFSLHFLLACSSLYSFLCGLVKRWGRGVFVLCKEMGVKGVYSTCKPGIGGDNALAGCSLHEQQSKS